MSEELKPCPFCGGTSGTDEQGETYRWRLWRCSDCGACGPEERCNITGSGQGGVKEARQIAAAAWNRRAHIASGEPVAYMWQHDETGRTGFVDAWQLQNGWRENNPRLHIVAPLYAAPQPAEVDAGK